MSSPLPGRCTSSHGPGHIDSSSVACAGRAGCATAFPSKDVHPLGGKATLQLAPARHLQWAHCGSHRKQALRQTCSREDPENAICVQILDDSLNSAIRTRYRILLRSSSMHKPRDPPLEVVTSSVRPEGLSNHHSRLPWLDKKQRPETLGRDSPVACAMTHGEELDRAPQGRAGDRIPTRVGTSTAAAPSACLRGSRGTVMILPQVHLRKPCYDFYFL